ncbi:MAG: restriction endonuclease, partial [bacterium]
MSVWQIELKHDGLKKYRIIRGRDKYVVEQKAAALKASWEEVWEKKIAREAAVKEKEDNKQLALERTQEAERKIDEVKNILQHTININDAVNWDSLLDKFEYPKSPPEQPRALLIPIEPIKSDRKFRPKVNFFISFFPKWEEKKIKESVKLFMREHSNWREEKQRIEGENNKSMEEYRKSLQEWEDKNKAILEKKGKYFDKDFDAIIEYCDMVLSNSEYPDTFPQVYDIGYNPETRILLLDYYLPSKENIPTLKEVKYIISQNKFKEIYISESELNNLYDDILYQITLRTIHELYKADAINAIASIIFNGYVKFIDKGTGKEITSCILSIQAEREEFLSINLKGIDPKTCFKILKGIGSSKLHGLVPIAPIMQLNKEDRRFVSPYTVIDSIDNVTNIAAMDWQDFENLIQELFEKEFAP